MAIPASQIVSVNPRLIQAGASDLAVNGLFLTESPLIPLPETALIFSDADSVADYFGSASIEYTAAARYFLGYNNSFSKPRELVIARRVRESVSGWLRGGPAAASLSELKNVSDGALSLTVDGEKIDLTGIDLTGVTSFSAAGQVIQTKLAEKADGVSATWSSLLGAFTVTSGTVGEGSSVDFAQPAGSGVDLASLLGLTKAAGATLSKGSEALSAEDTFRLIREKTDNWVTFTTLYEADEAEALALSKWASAQGVDFLYVCWSESAAILNGGDSLASLLEKENAGATAGIFGTAEHAAFVLGVAASINWNRLNGTINFAFKSQDGLACTAEKAADAKAVLEKGWSFYGRYATRNDQFVFLYDGAMYGDYKFMDAYINAVWLKNVLQAAIMNGLTSAGRVPYNDLGYSLVRAWCMDPVKRALYNGVINTGVTLSESQRAQLIQETGSDVSEELFTNGYYLNIAEPSAAIRADRDSPDVYLYYTYGGSVNKIVMASTMLA